MCKQCEQFESIKTMEQGELKQVTKIAKKDDQYFLVNAIIPEHPSVHDDPLGGFLTDGMRAGLGFGWGMKINYCPFCGKQLDENPQYEE